MKILNVGGQHLVPTLRQLGHEVFGVSSMDANANLYATHSLFLPQLLARIQGFDPDLLLWYDDGNLPQLAGLEDINCLSVFFSIDTFCNPWHVPFAQAFDLVLVAQKDHLDLFTKAGLHSTWFPLFFSGRIEVEDSQDWLEKRRIPASFVGTLQPRNIPNRLNFLQQTASHFRLHFAQGDFEPVFRQTKIVLNQSAAGELNYRCFEAMGCGAALLHDSILEGFCDLFRPGTNVLPPYTRMNAVDATAMLNYWTARPKRLAAIARAGCELIAQAHTAAVRANQLLGLVAEPMRQLVWQKRLNDLDRRKLLLSTAYSTLGLELPPEMQMQKDFFFWMGERLYTGGGSS